MDLLCNTNANLPIFLRTQYCQKKFEMSFPMILILFPEVERCKHWFVQDRVLTAAPLFTEVARSVEEKVTRKTIFWPPTHNSQVNNPVLSQNSQSVHARAIWLQKH